MTTVGIRPAPPLDGTSTSFLERHIEGHQTFICAGLPIHPFIHPVDVYLLVDPGHGEIILDHFGSLGVNFQALFLYLE